MREEVYLQFVRAVEAKDKAAITRIVQEHRELFSSASPAGLSPDSGPPAPEQYLQFVRAAEANDKATITRIIQEHPELHSFEGCDGCLLDVLLYNCPELFSAAFAAGLSPDSGPPAPHQTLLQYAVCDSDLELVRLCLRYGVDVERRNCEGETALGYAAAWASLDTVRLLVEAGADVNAVEPSPDGFGTTALDATFSCDPEHDKPEIRSYLREHGAKRYSELSPSPSA